MNKYLSFLVVALMSVVSWSCKDDDPEEVLPTIALTAPAADATVDLATATGVNFTWSVEGAVTGGYTLSLSQSVELTFPKTFTSSSTSKEFTISDLDVVLRDFGVADGATGKIYWSVKPTSASVKANLPTARALNVTRLPAPPLDVLTVTTENVSEITYTSAILNGSVTSSTFETTISERGFYYSTAANPQEGGTKVTVTGIATGSFSATLSGLSPGTAYYYVAFTTNNTGTTYGEAKSFKTDAPAAITASWLFDDAADLAKATVGKALTLVEVGGAITSVAGPTAEDKAIRLPVRSHLLADHGLVPPADADPQLVDEYTMVIDFKLPADNDPMWWYALMQTELANTGDGDLFIRNSYGIGVGSLPTGLGYSPNGSVGFGTWYRLVVSSSKVGDFYNFYLNGAELYKVPKSQNGRQSLDPLGVILFGDNDGEDNIIEVAAVTFWDKPLTDAEAAALGGF